MEDQLDNRRLEEMYMVPVDNPHKRASDQIWGAAETGLPISLDARTMGRPWEGFRLNETEAEARRTIVALATGIPETRLLEVEKSVEVMPPGEDASITVNPEGDLVVTVEHLRDPQCTRTYVPYVITPKPLG